MKKKKIEISMLLAALMIVWIPTAAAFPTQINACNNPGCHVYPPTSINVTTNVTTKIVNPGETFAISVSWTGGSSSAQTEAKWPTIFSTLGIVRDNSQFSPTPISSVAGVTPSGTLISTLTAPNTPGTYTLRVYASTGTGGNINDHETSFKDMTIMVRTPVAATYSISGFKVYSNNNTGVSGWPITLKNATITKTINTGPDGMYIFSGLENGTYNVTEGSRAGWTPVGPTTLLVTINGISATNKNFTNSPPTPPIPPPTVTQTYSISGFKINGNNNTGISGWQITLKNATLNQIVSTGTDGMYKFSNLANGTYNITEGSRTGWTPVGPTTLIVIVNGANVTNKNFTNTPPPTGPPPPTVAHTFSISGFKINGNNNAGISGWQITLKNATITQSTNTGTDGMYKFSNLANGTYNVTEGTVVGWTPISPTTLSVTINGANTTNKNFTNIPIVTRQGSISGYKINAATGKGIPKWVITLVGNNLRKKTTTDANGFYKFDNLPAGIYTVKEMLVRGFVPVTPPTIRIKLKPGQQSKNNNFKNMPKDEEENKNGEN